MTEKDISYFVKSVYSVFPVQSLGLILPACPGSLFQHLDLEIQIYFQVKGVCSTALQ